MQVKKWWFLAITLMWQAADGFSQQREREVTEQYQFWWSMNVAAKVSPKWAVIADLHVRRNNFAADPSFYLIRAGANYFIKPQFAVGAAYNHMWIAPSRAGWQVFANEHRLHQQAVLTGSTGKVVWSHRLRNEQRWQQLVANDKRTGEWRFTDRVRYQFYIVVPVSSNKYVPRLALSDEILVHFGKPVVYNTFDQNRFFVGIRQQLSKTMSFDFGYMHVYQQKFTGYQYDKNHTLRWFFFWTPDWSRHGGNPAPHIQPHEE
jgi:hypothetical protein